jgi:L-2-amino-thiazoline-4-carboxylic acid hydrolase-like protein
MYSDLGHIGILLRREIEAGVAAPLIKRFMAKHGEEEVLAEVTELMHQLAREAGAQLARDLGGNSLAHYIKGKEMWTRHGALDTEIKQQGDTVYAYDVTRCRYAEMYAELGIAELGYTLSCERDYALIQGFNPKIKLTRKQTIMEGAPICDFRYQVEV